MADGNEIELLSRIMRAAPYAVTICDACGRVVFVNDRCRALYGGDIEGSLNWHDRVIVHDEQGHELLRAEFPMFKAVLGQVIDDQLYLVKRRDDLKPISIRVTAHPLWRENEIIGAISLHRMSKEEPSR